MHKQIVENALRAAHTANDDIEARHRAIAADFEQSLAEDDYQTQLSDAQLSLSDYLTAVKMVLDDSLAHEVWVRAEVRAMTSKGGHYYFELAEKDDDGEIAASCRATLWRYRAKAVLGKFSATTGQTLAAGASVLIKCSASFHAQYGFSLNISDIDPNFTLGELAAAYLAMKKRLADEGLLTRNKQLPTPFDIRHVVVIAPEQAAGLGDFRAEADRLAKFGACSFYYHHATFQGNHAPSEIRAAISSGLADFEQTHRTLPDLLVIIRGGGAVGDLAYLNDFELAALVAESPVPVWVGIGHERDGVILDEVAHTSFDTPSKVILGIESHLAKRISDTRALLETIRSQAMHITTSEIRQSQRLLERICNKSLSTLTLTKQASRHQLDKLHTQAMHHSARTQLQLSALKDRMHTASQQQLTRQKTKLNQQIGAHKIIFSKLNQQRADCRHLQSLILIAHPARTLAKGYALIQSDDGKMIGSVADLQTDQSVFIKMHNGTAAATIHSVMTNDVQVP